MTDDRFDVTPAQCCDTCRHLVSSDIRAEDLCLRDNFNRATFIYQWDEPMDLQDIFRKSCPQWEAKENDNE